VVRDHRANHRYVGRTLCLPTYADQHAKLMETLLRPAAAGLVAGSSATVSATLYEQWGILFKQ
jgi:hypothetical protein